MQEENLNIDYNVTRLMAKALNKFGTIKEAANHLKVAEKTISRRISDFGLSKYKLTNTTGQWEVGIR